MKSVYLAHAVTNGSCVDNRFGLLVSWLGQNAFQVTCPGAAADPQELARASLESIGRSDIVIADVTRYSHGVGFELGYAYAMKKPIIVVADSEAKNGISNVLVGLFARIVFYDSPKDLASKVSAEVARVCRTLDVLLPP